MNNSSLDLKTHLIWIAEPKYDFMFHIKAFKPWVCSGMTAVERIFIGMTAIERIFIGMTAVERIFIGMTAVERIFIGMTAVERIFIGMTAMERILIGMTTIKCINIHINAFKPWVCSGMTAIERNCIGVTAIKCEVHMPLRCCRVDGHNLTFFLSNSSQVIHLQVTLS